MEFNDAVVVVTGGTRGIGRAISLAFAGAGACVYAAYLNNDQAAGQLVDDARSLAGSVSVIKADVSSSDGARTVIDAASKESGRLDVLVNNAGIIRDGFLAMMADDDWDAVIRTNLYPLFHCSKWGLRRMMAGRRGAIVNISSISAINGTAGQTNYSSSKAAILAFTKSLAREAGPLGVRVNAVTAGMIETDMTARLKKEIVEGVVKGAALGRIGRPEEVAAAVLFLASSQASYITGQSLIVDGGIV